MSPGRYKVIEAKIISTEMMWLSLAPISSIAERFYGVDGIWITLFTMSYMIMFVIFSIPASWVIDQYGYRCSLIIGSALTAIFGLTRAIFADSFTVVIAPAMAEAKGVPRVLALWICFLSMGVFNTILTLIKSILLPRGITSMEAGLIGAVFVIAGVLGAVILPVLSDRAGTVPFFITSIVLLVPL